MFRIARWLLLPILTFSFQFAVHAQEKIPRVAVITTVWHHNSHSDVIAGRLLQGHTLDGQGEFPKLKLASLYVDQFPERDKSRELGKQFGVPIYDTIAGALTLGGDKLAVDGILLIAEHGKYDESPTGSIQFPKRRMFGEIVKVFEASGRVVPVFSDKHLEDDRADIAWIWEQKQRLKIPMMAGSSLPTLWRYPPADVKLGEPLKEIVAVSYHRLDTYGFHALEMVQCLAERRKGGETGIKQVRCLSGDAVWEAGKSGLFDTKLLDEALARLKEQPLRPGKTLQELVKQPALFVLDYEDGLRASILTANGAVGEWTVAWRYGDGRSESTCFWTQEARPFMHFTYLLKGAERMIHTGQPAWPPERTLLTSGALDALLVSNKAGGKAIDTPQLKVAYQPTHAWEQPPEPPAGRPIDKQ
ncbi:MAG: hypothetical protein L0211_07705 [Planctomycetaceae bacterium]|nr:hypothetical protein [Planctomycetaceae bacterium]